MTRRNKLEEKEELERNRSPSTSRRRDRPRWRNQSDLGFASAAEGTSRVTISEMASGGSDAARRPEKSRFAITCSLLGKYIKEKGSLADLGLRVLDSAPSGKSEAYRPPTTMSLLSGVDVSGDDSSDVKEAKEPEKAQLTMFYGGKVMVYDNFPAEKAKDLMQLASKGQTFTGTTPDSVAAAFTDVQKCPAVTKPPASFPAGKFSDLPIARKSSLHRFLEKRKDRISTKGPYHLSSRSGSNDDLAVKKVEISQAWLGLA